MSGVIWLPQGIAYTFRLGPVLSKDDAKTRITDAVITQASRRLSKAGGAFAQSAQAGSLAHEGQGMYPCTLAAADVDTLGSLELDVDIANTLIAPRRFFVVTQDSYNALLGSGAGLRANVAAINGLTSAAIRMALAAGEMYPFTVDGAGFAPTATEFEASDIVAAGTDHYKDRSILWTSGPLKGQGCDITGYSVAGGRGHFTVTQLNAAPASGATGLII